MILHFGIMHANDAYDYNRDRADGQNDQTALRITEIKVALSRQCSVTMVADKTEKSRVTCTYELRKTFFFFFAHGLEGYRPSKESPSDLRSKICRFVHHYLLSPLVKEQTSK